MADSSVELRRLNQTLTEINKTLNRQNAILEKILRWQVIDHKEGASSNGGGEAGGIPQSGEGAGAEGAGGGSSETSLQQRAPSPRDIAETRKG